MTGPSAPSPVPPARLEPEAEREIQQHLDDALYYLRSDCVPCAERHFQKARLSGASEESIAAVWARSADPVAPLPVSERD